MQIFLIYLYLEVHSVCVCGRVCVFVCVRARARVLVFVCVFVEFSPSLLHTVFQTSDNLRVV